MPSRTDRAWRTMLALRPRTPAQLHRFMRVIAGVRIPERVLIDGHDAPFDYLTHSFFEREARDALVWASRGGGKTFLGAAATMLDLLFKPGVQVRILAGSLEQSGRMYAHLRALSERPLIRPLRAGEPTQRRLALSNGSTVELLAQSHRSVRGVRVHKLRCDEVEEMRGDIWQAAQLVTRSQTLGGRRVRGSVESYSTMHRPFGLMSELVRRAAAGAGPRLFRWCALDVAARCGPEHDCRGCPLWSDCQGKAKQADGFVAIDDLINQRLRTDDATWRSEMMCREPRMTDLVYPMFDVGRHVATGGMPHDTTGPVWIAGMDFGWRSPTVVLWARVVGEGHDQLLAVEHEYVAQGLTLAEHLRRIGQRDLPRPSWLGVDPAGGQRNGQTGLSDIAALRRAGHTVRARRSLVREGIDRVRCRLDHDRLVIHPRGGQLIEALSKYHFATDRADDETPVKDGPDHLCDALRYMVLNHECGDTQVQAERW